jgi:MYXO-CTERM domain-containing protein
VAGSVIDSCEAGAPAPTDADCDGLDDDCDGFVDEDFAPDPCVTGGSGVCAAGSTSCQAGTTLCVQETTAAADDAVCNGLDDDCDGSVDEDYASEACVTGDPGICSAGAARCENGSAVCVAEWMPQAEICDDGLDNDCDGAADLADDTDCPPTNCSGLPNGTPCEDGDSETAAFCHAGECRTTPVPEPGSASQWLAMLLGLAWARRRRQRGTPLPGFSSE